MAGKPLGWARLCVNGGPNPLWYRLKYGDNWKTEFRKAAKKFDKELRRERKKLDDWMKKQGAK
jgi:hypothetical protein